MSQLPIDELRSKNKEEISNYLRVVDETFAARPPEQVAKLSKKALLELAEAFIAQEKSATDIIQAIETASVNPTATVIPPPPGSPGPATVLPGTIVEPENTIPKMGDIEWTPYLIGLLDKSELEQNKPTNSGLRRLLRKTGMMIRNQEISVLKYPTMDDPNRASVVCRVEYYIHGLQGPFVMEEAADCSAINNQEPYCNHPLATATTLAESRCIRKILGLSVISSDEMKGPGQNQLEVAKSIDNAVMPRSNAAQKNAIQLTSTRLGINLQKLLDNTASVKNKDLETITVEEAQALMRDLGRYDRREIQIPIELIAD